MRAIKSAGERLLRGNGRGAEGTLDAARFDDIPDDGAERLFATDALIKAGMPAREALGKVRPGLTLAKYNPDEPRDERGRWTDGGGEQSTDDAPAESPMLQPVAATTTGATEADKEKFTDDHLADAQYWADKLHIPVENILGLTALESKWGKGPFVANGGNNYLSLYYPALYATGYAWNESHTVRMAVFASYSDCLRSFADRHGDLVGGISDPEEFAKVLQDAKLFGINPDDNSPMPDFVRGVSRTIQGFRARVARRKA